MEVKVSGRHGRWVVALGIVGFAVIDGLLWWLVSVSSTPQVQAAFVGAASGLLVSAVALFSGWFGAYRGRVEGQRSARETARRSAFAGQISFADECRRAMKAWSQADRQLEDANRELTKACDALKTGNTAAKKGAFDDAVKSAQVAEAVRATAMSNAKATVHEAVLASSIIRLLATDETRAATNQLNTALAAERSETEYDIEVRDALEVFTQAAKKEMA